jgi:hypothetical protein
VDTADVGQIHAEPAGNIHVSFNNATDQFIYWPTEEVPSLLSAGLQITHVPKFAKPES